MPFRDESNYSETYYSAVVAWMHKTGVAMDRSNVLWTLRQYYGERNWPAELRAEHDRLLRKEKARANRSQAP